jgi:hypothetical protein
MCTNGRLYTAVNLAAHQRKIHRTVTQLVVNIEISSRTILRETHDPKLSLGVLPHRQIQSLVKLPISPPTQVSTLSANDPRIHLDGLETILKQKGRFPDWLKLALLIQALGNSVPRLLFDRFRLPQYRWNENGSKEIVSLEEIGLDSPPTAFLNDTARLSRALADLDYLIQIKNDSPTLQTYTLSNQFLNRLELFVHPSTRNLWNTTALRLLCFVIPRDQYWEPE